jgi:hypothetical protein
MVVHIYNPATQDTEAGGSLITEVHDHTGQHRETPVY